MERSTKVLISLVSFILLLFILLSVTSREPVNWSPSYNTKDKIPMGMYILNNEIDSLFHCTLKRVNTAPGDYISKEIFSDSVLKLNTILCINPDLNWKNKDIEEISGFVRKGNVVFISSIHLPEQLMDTIGVSVQEMEYINQQVFQADTVELGFMDSCFYKAKITYWKGISGSYFTNFDSMNTSVIGYTKILGEEHVNFIRIRHGNGDFIVHLEPAVFTNYFLLRGKDEEYAATVLSNIPLHDKILWFQYLQTSRVISDSPLRFIFAQPSLYWAFLLCVAGVLLFVIFNIRRIQRIIRLIPKPENTTIEFAKTIGNLYYLEGNVRIMMDRKIMYLLEKLRNDFHLNTENLDRTFVHLLHARSGADLKIIEILVFLIDKHRSTDYTCTEHDLIRLNTAIENFFNNK